MCLNFHAFAKKPSFAIIKPLLLIAIFLFAGTSKASLAAPANDNFAGATALLANVSGSLNGENNNDTSKESNEPAHGDNVGGSSVWYTWQAPQSGWFTFDTQGSSFDTLLGIYTGTSVGALVRRGSNDDVTNSKPPTYSRAKFPATAGTVYRIAVDGYNGAHGQIALRWAPTPVNDDIGAAIALSPQASGAVSGTTAGGTYDANYYDENSVWYSWTAPSNGRLTVTAADSTITVFPESQNDILARTSSMYYIDGGVRFPVFVGATYKISVSRYPAGAAFTLNWNFTAAPANDNFSGAQTLSATASGSITTTNLGATHEAGEPEIAGYTNGDASVWYKWTAPTTGLVTFDTPGYDAYNRMMAAYTGSALNSLTVVEAHATGWERLRFRTVAGTTYHIVIDAPVVPEERQFTLRWAATTAPANDNFSAAETLSSTLTGTVSRANVGATWENGEFASHFDPYGGHASRQTATSVWFKWTAPRSGGFTFRLLNSNFSSLIQIYRGSTLTALDNTYMWQGYSSSSEKFHAIAGQQYYIAVDGFTGDEGSFDLNWLAAPDNDDFAAAQSLGTAASGSVTAANNYSTYQGLGNYDVPNPIETGVHPEGSSVWYRWTAPSSGYVVFQLSDSNFTNRLTVYSGTIFGDLTQIVQNYGGNGNNTSLAAFAATAGTAYSVRVDSPLTGEGYFKLGWNMPAPPANDNFAAAQLLSGNSGSSSGTNIAATSQPGEDSTGGASVWYKWTASADGRVTFRSPVNNFPLTWHVYTGTSLANLTAIRLPHTVADGTRFDTVAGQLYYLKVDSYSGGMGNFTIDWLFDAAPANDDFVNSQLLQPNTGSLSGTNVGATRENDEPSQSPGATVWYHWTAPSDGRFSVDVDATFSWALHAYTGSGYHNLEAVATRGSLYSTSNGIRFPVQAGVTYRISVGGHYYEEGAINLSWGFTPAPANDDFAASQSLGTAASGSASGTTRGATFEPNEPDTLGGHTDNSVWYHWTPAASGVAGFQVTSTELRNLIAVYTGNTLTALSRVVQDNGSASPTASRVSFKAQAGTVYRIAISGRATDGHQWIEDEFTLAWSQVTAPPNDDFANAQLIQGTSGNVTGSNVNATWQAGEPVAQQGGVRGGKTIWYKWVAPGTSDSTRNGKATFRAQFVSGQMIGSPVVGVFQGSSLAALQRVPLYGGETFTCVGGTTYYICVDGYYGADGGIELTWSTEPPPSNDNFNKRQALTDENAVILEDGTRQVTGTNWGAAKEAGEPNHGGDTGGASVWFSYTVPLNETAPSVSFRLTAYYSYLAVYTCPSSNVSLANLVPLTYTYSNSTGRLAFNVTPGQTYYIAVDGQSGLGSGFNSAMEGPYTLSWKPAANLSVSVTPTTFGEAASQSGQPAATGTLTIDAPLLEDISISLTSSDTTEATVDASATIPAGSTTAEFSIYAVDDQQVDGPQTVTIIASGAGLVEAAANITVTDDDVAGIVVSNNEGLITAEYGGTANFAVKLSSQPAADVKVRIALNGAEGRFYNVNDGTNPPSPLELTFTPENWSTEQWVYLQGTDDTVRDGDRTFSVAFNPAVSTDANYTGRTAPGFTVTNTDDEADPTLVIDSVAIEEGHRGTKQMVFTVTLSGQTYLPVSVQYTTADNSATAGSDYVAKQGTLTFAANDTNLKRTIAIDITGDKVYEEDETFNIYLSNESNASIENGTAEGTIKNDDATPGSLQVTVTSPADESYRR